MDLPKAISGNQLSISMLMEDSGDDCIFLQK